MKQPASWIAGGAGILFPLFLHAAMTLEPQSPPYDDTGDQAWADYYRSDPAQFSTGFYLEMVGLALFLVFLGGLGARLAHAERDEHTLSRIAMGAGLAIAFLGFVSLAFRWPLVWADTHTGVASAPSRTLALQAETVHNAVFSLELYLFALLAAPAGLSMLRNASFPRWFAWTTLAAAAIAALHSIEALAPSEAGWVYLVHTLGFYSFLLWPIVTGVTMMATAAKDHPIARTFRPQQPMKLA